jgi:hypothetical protein
MTSGKHVADDSLAKQIEVLNSVFIPHEGPISILVLCGSTDEAALVAVQERIQHAVQPLLDLHRQLSDEAAIGLADPHLIRSAP